MLEQIQIFALPATILVNNIKPLHDMVVKEQCGLDPMIVQDDNAPAKTTNYAVCAEPMIRTDPVTWAITAGFAYLAYTFFFKGKG